MAMTLSQSALTPTSPQIPSIAALGNPTKPQFQQSPLETSPLDPNAPPIGGVYVDPVTGQLMIPGAKGTPNAPGQPTIAPQAYNWNADQSAVGSIAHRIQQDPGFYRPDGGGR